MRSVTMMKEFSETLTVTNPPLRLIDKDRLTIMCHEVGTPLSAIVGLSYILSDVECSKEKKMECAEMLRDSSSMLLRLMKNLLDSSKIDAEMLEVESIDFDPAQLVKEAANIIATRVAEKGLDLNVHVAKDISQKCIGDPMRILQILVNLLSNAVKFTEHGSVSVYVDTTTDRDEKEYLHIEVADTGIGMNKASLEKIFNKYAQADITTSREYGGTGLGLSISQALAQLMNGDISVKSCQGVGTCFTVNLPMYKTDDAQMDFLT